MFPRIRHTAWCFGSDQEKNTGAVIHVSGIPRGVVGRIRANRLRVQFQISVVAAHVASLWISVSAARHWGHSSVASRRKWYKSARVSIILCKTVPRWTDSFWKREGVQHFTTLVLMPRWGVLELSALPEIRHTSVDNVCRTVTWNWFPRSL